MSESKTDHAGPELGTVIIYTERMAELARFYEDGLGLPPFRATGPDHLGQAIGPVYLGFDQADLAPSGSAVTVWFTVHDIQLVFDRLVSMGARVRYPPTEKPWGALLAAVYDPDGNLLGLSEGRSP
jgi:predicted enzyme related to lactoylglutathione lyase